MKAKVLPSRRKKASKGKPIRVSDEVYNLLQKKRQDKMSWDALFRKMFGLPDRKGSTQPLLEGFLEVNTGQFYFTEEEARGASVVQAAKQKTNKVKKPIKMREVV